MMEVSSIRKMSVQMVASAVISLLLWGILAPDAWAQARPRDVTKISVEAVRQARGAQEAARQNRIPAENIAETKPDDRAGREDRQRPHDSQAQSHELQSPLIHAPGVSSLPDTDQAVQDVKQMGDNAANPAERDMNYYQSLDHSIEQSAGTGQSTTGR
ncbi:MAG TPA: hypothetical protein VFS39_16295 [Nitrospira sp.]|nr:hypothetical protein [Nitrospira sp.]